MKFWIPFGIDAIVAAVFVVFFVIGIADGSVSSFNIVLWVAILGALGLLLGGALALRAKGQLLPALVLLWLLAVPALLVGLLLLLAIIFQPRWN